MKIYNKGEFVWGIMFAGILLLFAFGVLEAEWWQWLFATVFAARGLYNGLTESGSRRMKTIEEKYPEVGKALYGKYYWFKAHLLLIFLAAFFAAALILRFAFEIYLPDWAWLAFMIILPILCAYSIGIGKSIQKHIDEEIEEAEEEQKIQ